MHNDMNILDIGILIIVALTTFRGFFRGIIQEAATLFGIIASFFLASFYYKELASWLGRYYPHHSLLAGIFCFILIFVLSFFLFHFFAIIIRKAVHLALLGWLDRVLGGLFGLIKGAVIVFFLVTLLTLFSPKSSPLVKDSRFFPAIQTVNEKLALLIPFKIKNDYMNKKKELQEYWTGKKRTIKKMQKVPGDE